jgi:hypothetical protein
LLQRINNVQKKWYSHDKNILLALEKNAFLDHLHLWVPVGNLALVGLYLPITALVGITGRRKILTSTQKIYNKMKAWATMLIKTYPSWPESHETRHAKASNEITDSSLLASTSI